MTERRTQIEPWGVIRLVEWQAGNLISRKLRECWTEAEYTEACSDANDALKAGKIIAWQGFKLWSF